MPPSVHFLCLILTPSVESLCDIIRLGCRTLARGEDSDNRRIVQQRTNGTLTRLIVFYWIWLLFHVRKFSKGGGRSMWWGTEIENQASSLDVVNKKFIMMKISAMTVNVNACFQGLSRTLNISFSLIRIFSQSILCDLIHIQFTTKFGRERGGFNVKVIILESERRFEYAKIIATRYAG